MSTVEMLEAAMLISFSISWYWSIAKMLQTRIASGKSFVFVMMICAGYTMGITSKLVEWQATGVLSPLIYVYGWNFLVTAVDAALVIRFSQSKARNAEVVPVGG